VRGCHAPSFQYVAYIEVGEMDFKTPGMKRKLAAQQRNSAVDYCIRQIIREGKLSRSITKA